MIKTIRKNKNSTNQESEDNDLKISLNLLENINHLEKTFNNCTDIVIRKLYIASNPKYKAALIYLDGMLKEEIIELAIINKLIEKTDDKTNNPGIKKYCQYLLGINDNNMPRQMNITFQAILNGNAVLFIDGIDSAIIITLKNPPERNIVEPPVEGCIRGPREGFTESIRTNTCLLRKKIKNINLKLEHFTIGKQTKTDIIVAYLSNIANEKIVEEVRLRLKKIDIDSILDSSYIEEYVKDGGILNIFPTVFRTEKPDIAAGKLLEGKIAIITDGSPTILLVPCIFIEHIQAGEDYYNNYVIATIDRGFRFVSFILSLLLPAFWVSISTFHHELIPTSLVVTVVKARSGLPFPTLVEAFFMMIAYEIIREAGIRMPEPLGQAISVVGALVLGQSAVSAGLVSTPMVIVVAVAGIATYAIPSIELTRCLIIPRYIFLFLAGTLGLIGLLSGLLVLLIYLISLRSFGVPYIAPFAPLVVNELKDTIIRAPLSKMNKRPTLFTWKYSLRSKSKK
ncbi:spore germination protein [Clostridium sediminicola]|uniref:spore germination protein n=1 Tax=Clostridium sediminicola TaxID=3114879 RepID=UPI003D177F4E